MKINTSHFFANWKKPCPFINETFKPAVGVNIAVLPLWVGISSQDFLTEAAEGCSEGPNPELSELNEKIPIDFCRL